MPTSSLDLLALAKQLQHSGANEASARAAVSRAYYSALHEVLAVFDPRPASDQRRSESSHVDMMARAEVYAKNANPGRLDAGEIAKMWPKFKRMRVTADYAIGETITTAHSQDAISRCERVHGLCAEVVRKQLAQTL